MLKLKKGDHVSKGDLIADMNIDMIKKEKKDPTVIVVLTQTDKQLENKSLGEKNTGDIIGHVVSVS